MFQVLERMFQVAERMFQGLERKILNVAGKNNILPRRILFVEEEKTDSIARI